MYKNSNNNNIKCETTEAFLVRGGKITKLAEGDSYKRKTRKPTKINAQALLDGARNEYEEQSVINFLKTQGIKVI